MKRTPPITFARLSAIVLFVVASVEAVAQTGRTDTASAARAAAADTVFHPTIPIPLGGSIDRTLAPSAVTGDSVIDFTHYRYPGDLLTLTPGIFMRDLGTPGQLGGVTLDGADAHAISFLNDGVPLADPFTGLYNLNLYPTENIARIEVIPGTRAFLYGLNSGAGAINFVSKTKKAIKPFSRIRYSESAYQDGFFDGMFSQDIIRNLNLTLGVGHATFGPKFPNDQYDDWMTRVKLRYNISNSVDVYITDIYNQTNLGLNGGADTATDILLRYDPRQATMLNTDSYEKITRHDLQAGVLLRVLPDSDDISTVALYHNTQLREYRDEDNRPYPNAYFVQEDFRSQWYGVKLTQHLSLPVAQLDGAAELGSRGLISGLPSGQHLERLFAVSGKAVVRPADPLTGTAAVRLDRYLGWTRTSAGGDIAVGLTPWAEIFAGYSSSWRFPTIQELSWRDNVVSGPATLVPERHDLTEVGLRLGTARGSTLSMKYFHRSVKDPIIVLPGKGTYPFPTARYSQPRELLTEGVDAGAAVRIGSFYIEGSGLMVTVKQDSIGELVLPKFSGTGGVYFWDTLFSGHLDLKVGLRGRFLSQNRGEEYNPQAMLFVPGAQVTYNMVGSGDLVIMFHIGSAYVHFIWENLVDQKYIVVPFYPMPDRAIKLGISWEFIN